MGTVYLTPEQLEAIVGRRHLAVAAPDADDCETWDAATVQTAIDAVSDMVDARLRTRYAIPLDDVPEFVRRAVARLVHYELVDEPANTELIETRATEARKIVDGLASGKLQIGADSDGDGEANDRTRHGRAVLHTPKERTFRRRDTQGIV
ncbi:MAG: DUF1320 family protein [Rhodospirillaceae bacterium]|nr:DUF1320 family protein [Rhodospirillaceae bacterium]